MRSWGCFGLALGSLIGLLILVFILLLSRPVTPVPAPPPPIIPADVTLFVSEQTVSRLASQTLQRPTVVDFESNGQMLVTTRTRLGGVEPVMQAGLLLELQGTEVVSELYWARLGFLTIPANWLPPEQVEAAALVGQTINNQIPPDFSLVGLATSADGVTFQLKWVGQ
jgi:hypothetical protein